MSLQSTDPIADLLTRIRNAAMVGKHEVRVPTSKLKKVVAEQLVKNKYLEAVALE
ncbi:30S ribosomal protein S8, partial [Candidatus Saccharibacteria bacterium 32-50-10]